MLIAALRLVRQQQPAELICAVPVAACDSLAQVATLADKVVCLNTVKDFRAVSQYYENFAAVEDDEVLRLLARP